TGALTRKVGRFELAHQGTLFLDEVGDLPLELQAKLLRVLQEGEFERVGGTQTLKVDVRLITATNRDLERAVSEGRFRADLYYRLNVFPIVLPPLRERPRDILRLARHFAMLYAAKRGKPVGPLSADVLDRLAAYAGPGNVRELQNVIERAVILSSKGEFELPDLLPPAGGSPPEPLRSLENVERQLIVAVLEETRWRVSGERGAARILGLKRTTLEARMKKVGIFRPSSSRTRDLASRRPGRSPLRAILLACSHRVGMHPRMGDTEAAALPATLLIVFPPLPFLLGCVGGAWHAACSNIGRCRS